MGGASLARLSRVGALRPLIGGVRLPRRAAAVSLRRAQGVPACRRFLRRFRPDLGIVLAVPTDEAELARRFGLRVDLGPRHRGTEVAAFVARKGGARSHVIGFVELVQRPLDAAPYDGSWIHATMAAPQYRGMGIAEALVLRAVGAARQAGASEVRLTVFADNPPALALYRKLGFVPSALPGLNERLAAETARGPRQVALRLVLTPGVAAFPNW